MERTGLTQSIVSLFAAIFLLSPSVKSKSNLLGSDSWNPISPNLPHSFSIPVLYLCMSPSSSLS